MGTLRCRAYVEEREITMSVCAALVHEPQAQSSAVVRRYSDGMSWVVRRCMAGAVLPQPHLARFCNDGDQQALLARVQLLPLTLQASGHLIGAL